MAENRTPSPVAVLHPHALVTRLEDAANISLSRGTKSPAINEVLMVTKADATEVAPMAAPEAVVSLSTVAPRVKMTPTKGTS